MNPLELDQWLLQIAKKHAQMFRMLLEEIQIIMHTVPLKYRSTVFA